MNFVDNFYNWIDHKFGDRDLYLEWIFLIFWFGVITTNFDISGIFFLILGLQLIWLGFVLFKLKQLKKRRRRMNENT